MVKRRVANPSPAILSLVNPKGRKRKMAATKRRRRTNTSNRRKPAAKRRNLSLSSIVKSPRRRSRKRANPIARKRTRGRRRNPISSGVIAEGFRLGASGLIIGFAQPTVRNLVGRFLPTGPIASVGITLATGYGLGALAGFTRFTASWKRPLELAGWTIAGAQLISTYVLPALSGFTSGLGIGDGATASGLGRSRRMRDIVTLPAGKDDPYYGSTPAIGAAPVSSKVATMKDILTMANMPGRY